MSGRASRTVDLNADLGEGFGAWKMGDDDALLTIVSSANVACGFHAGDPSTMRRVCERAAALGVAVGAHVSYWDLAGFGRRRIEMPPEVLRDEILYQLSALAGMAGAAGTEVGYLKAHGALYNQAADDPEVAQAVVSAAQTWNPALSVLCLPGSVLADAARIAGLPVVAEGYLDRAYDKRGRLVPRGVPGAVIDDPATVARRALDLTATASTESVDGHTIELVVSSLCVHGDTPGAVEMARRVRTALEDAGVAIASFVDVTPASPASGSPASAAAS